MEQTKNVGLAGLGAMGKIVASALVDGKIKGMRLAGVSEVKGENPFNVENVDFETLADKCDLICECLPAKIVPDLALAAFAKDKDMVVITSAALLIYPQILTQQKESKSRIFVPSGALAGMDGVRALAASGQITSAKIISTKPPSGFGRSDISQKTCLFKGSALDAAKAFPANVNVAATLSIAGIGGQKTQVEVWADPNAQGNSHEIVISTPFSTITSKVEGKPSPDNPKTSMLAAYSVISTLQNMTNALVIG